MRQELLIGLNFVFAGRNLTILTNCSSQASSLLAPLFEEMSILKIIQVLVNISADLRFGISVILQFLS